MSVRPCLAQGGTHDQLGVKTIVAVVAERRDTVALPAMAAPVSA